MLRLKDSAGKVLSEGSESFIKKTTSRVEGGLPKVLDYGPHDVTFRNVAHIAERRWYQLSLSIVRRGNFAPGTKPEQPDGAGGAAAAAEGDSGRPPILACRCKSRVAAFGATLEFEPSVRFEPVEQEGGGGGDDGHCVVEGDGALPGSSESSFAYGLISRIYFYH